MLKIQTGANIDVYILTLAIEKKIRSGIIESIMSKEFHQAAQEISGVLVELYANIPEKSRASYGVVYTIKVLSEYLYVHLEQTGVSVYEIAKSIYEESDCTRPKCVALGVMSFYGLGDLKKTLHYFETAAASGDWEMREITQMLFRKLIARHPEDVRTYLLSLVASPDKNMRRFVAETLRPVQENRWFYEKPEYPLSILRNMFKESSSYPRTSVGNNLSDLARKLPEVVYGLVRELVSSGDDNSYWIAYRACRNLVKLDPIKVMDILRIDEYRYKERIYRRVDYQRD